MLRPRDRQLTGRRWSVGAVVCLALVGVAACGDEAPPEFARVGDLSFSMADIRRQLRAMDMGGHGREARMTYALRKLIRAEWTRRELRRRGLHDGVSREGPTRAQKRLLADIGVSNAEIERFCAAHRKVLELRQARDAWFLRVDSISFARRSIRSLEKGASWETAIQQATKADPTAVGDALPFVAGQVQDERLARALFAASPDVLTGPFRTPRGVYVVQVIGETPWADGLTVEGRKRVIRSVRKEKLARMLRKRYAPITTCAHRWRIPAVAGLSECA